MPDLKMIGEGLSKTIKEYGNLRAQDVKLRSALLANQFEKKQNLLYKLQERQLERQQNLEFAKQMQAQLGGGQQDEVTAPTIKYGSDFSPSFDQPSAADQKFRIQKGWALIDRKQAAGMPLNDIEKGFMEKYPKSMLTGGKDKTNYLHTLPPTETNIYGSRKTWFGLGKEVKDKVLSTVNVQEALSKPVDQRAPEENTLIAMQNIKSEDDINHLLQSRQEYEKMGVDVQHILDYYKPELDRINKTPKYMLEAENQ